MYIFLPDIPKNAVCPVGIKKETEVFSSQTQSLQTGPFPAFVFIYTGIWAASNFFVYVCFGWLKTSSTVPISTISPSYMTATRWQTA